MVTVDDGEPYMTIGAAKRFRGYAWALAAIILLLGIIAWIALDARDTSNRAVEGNSESIVIGCHAVNDLRDALVEFVASNSNSSITQADVDAVQDPELRRLVQAIVTRAAQRDASTEIEKLPRLDCVRAAQRGR